MLAIIPARGGSKGLPGKNIRSLAGKPLIAHTILSALNASSVSQVVVSTDDEQIADVAIRYGAEVPELRPESLATDNSMVMDTYFHVFDKVSAENKVAMNAFIALLPTVPLRNSSDIDEAVMIYQEKAADSVISVTEAPVPIQWYRKIKDDGTLADYLPDFNAVLNRQELEMCYVPNGAVYVFNVDVLRRTRQYYTKKTYPYIMPRERSADIDNLIDFEWAEFLYYKNSNNG